MLSLVEKYGLSHVCANSEFIDTSSADSYLQGSNYPYLDIYLSTPTSFWDRLMELNIEFFFRGTEDEKFEFQN